MFKSFIYRILEKRHFWRQASFGEIADLYAAQVLRTAAVYLVSGFSSVYLYKQGYSLVFIMTFWAIYFGAKTIISPFAGLLVARLGTTASTMLSNIMHIPAIIALSLIPEIQITGLIIYGICLSLSVTLHEICYYTDFSRVKSVRNCGKEIGFMNILEKVVITASPVIGGLIALKFNVEVTMWLASFTLMFAGVPLIRQKNKPDKRHRVSWQSFPWKLALPSIIAELPMGFDAIASSTVWGLFIAIILLPLAGNGIYVAIGSLSSVTLVVAIITSSIFGKLIDNAKGGLLMRVGIGINVVVHLIRMFVSTVAGAIGINVVNEVASAALGMSFMRGIFDIADTSGYRIVYIILLNAVKNLGSSISCLVMVGCVLLMGDGRASFQFFYGITAMVCAAVIFCKFKIYRQPRA